MRAWWIITLLSGCQSLPIAQADGGVKTLYVYPQPSCMIICNSNISAIREDVRGATGNVATGAKSNAQTTQPSKVVR